MPTFPKDDVGYESGGWPATDLPNLAAKPAPRRKGRSLLKWAAIVMLAAAWSLLYYYLR